MIANLKKNKFWKNKKVFVTGHTGFKGGWLCLVLKFLGAKVTGYSLKPLNKKNLFDDLEPGNTKNKPYLNLQNSPPLALPSIFSFPFLGSLPGTATCWLVGVCAFFFRFRRGSCIRLGCLQHAQGNPFQ